MITLVNLVGFLIQMIVCPILMLPWLLVRLLVSKMPTPEESGIEVELPELQHESFYPEPSYAV